MMSSKRDKNSASQEDGAQKRSGGVNYSAVVDRQVGDSRFERERNSKLNDQKKGVSGLREGATMSSTFDAFQRMAAGLEGRKIADKISDPNRPTWEQYKKENEDKLDLVGTEVRKMVEYRAQLDKEREQRLNRATQHGAIDAVEKRDKMERRKRRKEKKEKRKEKHRKRKHGSSSSSSNKRSAESDSEDGSATASDDDSDNSSSSSNGSKDNEKKKHRDKKKKSHISGSSSSKHSKKRRKHKSRHSSSDDDSNDGDGGSDAITASVIAEEAEKKQ